MYLPTPTALHIVQAWPKAITTDTSLPMYNHTYTGGWCRVMASLTMLTAYTRSQMVVYAGNCANCTQPIIPPTVECLVSNMGGHLPAHKSWHGMFSTV